MPRLLDSRKTKVIFLFTHITLLAGGTIAQDIHCDFLNWPGEATQAPVPLSKWFGSGIYLFKNYQTPFEQPAVLIRERPRDEFKDPDGHDRSKIAIQTNETTQSREGGTSHPLSTPRRQQLRVNHCQLWQLLLCQFPGSSNFLPHLAV